MEITQSDLYRNLCSCFDQIEIIDTHEHLPSEAERLRTRVDFSTLFSHYCMGDLVTAGLKPEEQKILQDMNVGVEEKWKIFIRYYGLIKSGGYSHAARIAMENFYGVPDLTSLEDAILLTERIRQGNQLGIYKRIFKEACHIQKIFLFNNQSFATDFFYFVDCLDHLCCLNNIDDLQRAASEMGGAYHTLQDYVDSLGEYIKQKAERGVKGIKFTCAYYRTLDFKPIAAADAERIFNKLFSAEYLINNRLGRYIDNADTMILHDYLTLRILDFCDRFGLTAVFHTGLLADNRNYPINAHPEPLWRLFYTYPSLKFVLLHGGLPWTDEIAMLAKAYPNVYIDMAWMHCISPEIAVRGLKTWIDMVPKNKIFGFGGDYSVPEKVYGHLMMARNNISRALSEKVLDGSIKEEDACSWIEHLLRINAMNVYNIDG